MSACLWIAESLDRADTAGLLEMEIWYMNCLETEFRGEN